MKPRDPVEIIPAPVGRAVDDQRGWFVIGGQAVRCFCPYRPSLDVDLGVLEATDLDGLLAHLERSGSLELLERSEGTAHARFEGIKTSIFVLKPLAPFVDGRRLGVTGVLATKLHAILDRGARRDFFDLYVTLQCHGLGIAECLSAIEQLFPDRLSDGLLLRALTFFDDADREAPLPGEGPADWNTVQQFFLTRVGQLLVPPTQPLKIQQQVVLPEAPAPHENGG
jgi:hypothetical protein